MKRQAGLCYVVSFLLLSAAISAADDEPNAPWDVGNRTSLFLDDDFLAEQAGLKRTWHQGQPHPEAIVAETEPNDHWILLHGSCFYDPESKVYRMYYQSTHLPSGVPGVSFLDLICYAESKDGTTWVKPKLGLVEFRGSKDNNIVLELAGPPNVFVDPLATDRSKRLRMLTYATKGRGPTEGHPGLCWLTSEDGLQWTFESGVNTPTFADPTEAMFNDLFIVGWDDRQKSYIGNWRGFSKHTIGNLQGNRRRAIGRTMSPDLQTWTPSVTIVRPDELDDRKAAAFGQNPDAPDWAELYIMPSFSYGNHHLGLVTLFCMVDAKDLNGGGDLQFCYSHDGLKWKRQPDRQTAMAPGGDPALFPCFAQFSPPLDMGNEIWIFYSEANGVHGIQDWQKSRGRIRAAVWRKDGFVSLDAAEKGTFTTRPLSFTGDELHLNFDTRTGGSVRVAVLDQDGKPLPGFTLDDCLPLTGDAVSQPVVWKNGSELSQLEGKPIRLNVELSNSRLWSFRFAQR
ncbi:MAG: hypothetical protein ACKVT0_14515 [Planctomycetaceae bacterium]